MNQTLTVRRNATAKRRFSCHRALFALGLASAALLSAASIAEATVPVSLNGEALRATPALWEVHDGDTTIYLFGTFHTLDDSTLWFDRSVRAAFERSGELVLETIAPTDPRQIRAIARAVVGPAPASTSFLGQTSAAVAQGRASGLSVDRGAEAVLRRAAAYQGKNLIGIEGFADQLYTFSRIPAAAPQPVTTNPAPPVTLAELLSAWKAGDTRAFSTMLAGFDAKAPAAYRTLIADRNALYGGWIEQRLNQPGTVFVAVGSGHLAGKDSIQNWLSSKGIVAHRIG